MVEISTGLIGDILGSDATRAQIDRDTMEFWGKMANKKEEERMAGEDYKIGKSGKDVTFDTGAKRDHKGGKGHFHCLPPLAMRKLAEHFEKGAEAHGDRNWEKGMPIASSYIDSGLRHLFAELAGEGLFDKEDHLISAFWNIACAVETRERIRRGVLPESLDDTPRFLCKVVEPLTKETQEKLDNILDPPEPDNVPIPGEYRRSLKALSLWGKSSGPCEAPCDTCDDKACLYINHDHVWIKLPHKRRGCACGAKQFYDVGQEKWVPDNYSPL
ncbi:hypothetical protein LCGC14_1132360 [marine sediment metagenome]|uniref:dATP/dGTP diphosphohydrolase N-terminal domain-containing protein n=1 Tax=marine sediment metagenome TaxID=412755 RepID=A0A0F9M0P1_9ZZZZ